jgi:carbamoyltransferase
MDVDSPYMLLVGGVQNSRRLAVPENATDLWGIDLLNVPRSDIPAVTHIDYSARVQTVHKDTNPKYHKLLEAFEALTGCPVIVNTSFNVRGEPIVGNPEDAYRCFMRTEIDVLVLGNQLVYKADQKAIENDVDWRKEFVLD